MLKSLVLVLGLALLLACGTEAKSARRDAGTQQQDAGAGQAHDAAADASPNDPDGGAKGDSTGSDSRETHPADAPAQCEVARCERLGKALAQSIMTPSEDVTTVKGGECTRVDIAGVVAGLACTCITSNGWIYIGPDGAGCYARGRAGDCLWDDHEFRACTQGDPACTGMCDELGHRYAADAAKSFDVEVRSSTCRHDSCRQVLRIGDDCFTDRSISSGRRFDCKLSDSEILDREDSAQ